MCLTNCPFFDGKISFQLLQVEHPGKQTFIGYLNSSSLEGNLDLNHDGIVEIISNTPEPKVFFGKRVDPNGNFFDFKIKSEVVPSNLLLDFKLTYKDSEGHEHQQFFKIQLFNDGNLRNSSPELPVEILATTNSNKEIVIRIKRPQSLPTGQIWLKSYLLQKVYMIGSDLKSRQFPVNFEMIPPAN